MKTKKDFAQHSHLDARLINAVISQFGGWKDFKETARDVERCGMEAGFHRFIYYADTHKFAMKNRNLIVSLLEEAAESMGADVVSMVGSFGVFGGDKMEVEDKKDLYKFLGDGRPSPGKITNVMAWFAAEEVCRSYCDML
jgi:hypothetical protein